MNNTAKAIKFCKYQGTGNDFILIDNREEKIRLTKEEIASLCHRRFGIGADGLMLLESAEGYDFYMRYYNSDGAESSMCGNGGRCITAFAKSLHMGVDTVSFLAIDGPHEARILPDGTISLSMQDVTELQEENGCVILDTGSPHYILWTDKVSQIDVAGKGREIRNLPAFEPNGINVNFVKKEGNALTMRTYERGVEDETYSCGTGATAAAIAASGNKTGNFKYRVETLGGLLEVTFLKKTANQATEVWLTGPATMVFEGHFSL